MISKSKCPFCGSQVKIIKAHVTMFRCNNDECGAMVSFRGPVNTRAGFYEAENPERNFKRRSK